MCNPLLDISAVVPLEMLTKYDVKPGNAVLAEPSHVPVYGELVEKYKVEYIAGGAGQNTIRVAQWMLKIPNKTVSGVKSVQSAHVPPTFFVREEEAAFIFAKGVTTSSEIC
jgi:hypothetical protein